MKTSKMKKILCTTVALLCLLAYSIPAYAAEEKKEQEPISVNATATALDGYKVTVANKTTPAVRAAGTDWPITKYYFIAENGSYLGSISGAAMTTIIEKYQTAKGDAPGGGEWEFWFAEQFNIFRGLSSGGTSAATSPGSNQGENTSSSADTAAFAEEVIRLINQKREAIGLNVLDADADLMTHATVRAKELASQYSHARPNGTKETSECIVMRRDSPAAAVKAWMESDPHRDAILNESGRFPYQTIGSGCYQDAKGVLYWVITFGTGSGNNDYTEKNTPEAPTLAQATYTLNETSLNLSAGESYSLSVDSSAAVDNMRVEWSASRLSDGILSVDSDGNITTYFRSGMSSAKATLTVTAKVYVSDRVVKTLNCKVTVTQ